MTKHFHSAQPTEADRETEREAFVPDVDRGFCTAINLHAAAPTIIVANSVPEKKSEYGICPGVCLSTKKARCRCVQL
jgi:hypothetical protein